MLSENGYLYLNAKEVLKNINDEYKNIPKLMILTNYSSGEFLKNMKKRSQ